MTSLFTSPTHSAAPSRAASDISDDEDDDLDLDIDDTASAGSAPELFEDNGDGTSTFDPKALIENLQDRKHNNSEVREHLLQFYINIMRSRYTSETHLWLDDAAQSLAEVFLRDANRGSTARERLLSLKAYCLTVGSTETTEMLTFGERMLKQILKDDDDEDCQIFATYALCLTVLYSGGNEEAALEAMEYLVEIVQSDGETIDSYDNAPVVAAVLRAWAFVASHVSDFSTVADAALEAFVDQLESSDVEVQSNAAACIALIYESSRSYEEDSGEPFQLEYDPQRLSGRLNELARMSAKSVSRKGRRDLREMIVSVVTSLERGVGPYYSTAKFIPERDQKTSSFQRMEDGSYEYGYRSKFRVSSQVAVVDTWSLLSRINLLKIVFRGGLQAHAENNPVVLECLDDLDFEMDSTGSRGRRA